MSELDCLLSLANLKEELPLCARPCFSKENVEFKANKIYHPCVERVIKDRIVYNDVVLDS
jgi:DNA mismatch repair ATPase MutS